MNNAEPTKEIHIPALDGIRGLAVLVVMIRHFHQGMDLAAPLDRVWFTVSRLGSNGVDIFFVLSGFLITGILVDSKGRRCYFSRFYLRRTVRIFPLYYAALAFSFWVAPQAGGLFDHAIQAAGSSQAWFWLYASNWLFAFKGDYIGLAHFWSLAIEEQFYLVWPLLVYLTPRRLLAPGCVFVVAGSLVARVLSSAAGVPVMVIYVMTHTRLDCLAIGALAAMVYRLPDRRRELAVVARWAGAACLVLLCGLTAVVSGGERSPLLMVVGPLFVGVLAASWIIEVTIQPGSRALTSAFLFPPLVWLGRYSYCLYVVHPLVQSAVERLGYRDSLIPSVLGSHLPGRLLFVGICLSLSAFVAVISWRYLEERFLRLKRLIP